MNKPSEHTISSSKSRSAEALNTGVECPSGGLVWPLQRKLILIQHEYNAQNMKVQKVTMSLLFSTEDPDFPLPTRFQYPELYV